MKQGFKGRNLFSLRSTKKKRFVKSANNTDGNLEKLPYCGVRHTAITALNTHLSTRVDKKSCLLGGLHVKK